MEYPKYLYRFGIPVAAVGLASLALYLVADRYVRKFRNVFTEMGLVQVKKEGASWTGTWDTYVNTETDFFQVELDLVRENGKMFGFFEGRQPAIMVTEPELIRQVLLKDFESFVDRRVLFPIRSRPIDFALTLLTGDRWKHVRQQVTPAFTPNGLRRMMPLITKTAQQFAANVDRKSRVGEEIDLKLYCGCFTMDVIAAVAFGLDLDSLNNPNNEFVTNARAVFAQEITKGFLKYLITACFVFPFLTVLLVKLMPKSSKMMRPVLFFQDMIEKTMVRRRLCRRVEYGDFLEMVMDLEKDPNNPEFRDSLRHDEFGLPWLTNGLTHDEIVGQAFLFFLAGFDTTASVLSMVLYSLAANPDCQERLFSEIAAKDVDSLTMDELNELKYLQMCIDESLRMFAPLTRVERMCTSDTSLGGYPIRKGMTLLVPINAIHHDPTLWPDPDKFDPERFANPESISPFEFLPFGLGNRSCVGMRLAYLEMKLAIVHLIKSFRFSVSPYTKLPIQWRPGHLRSLVNPIYLRAVAR